MKGMYGKKGTSGAYKKGGSSKGVGYRNPLKGRKTPAKKELAQAKHK